MVKADLPREIDGASSERGDQEGNDCRACQARASARTSTNHFSDDLLSHKQICLPRYPLG
jgi:hypothetical protein